MADNEELKNKEEKSDAGSEIDSVIDILDLDELCRKYGIVVPIVPAEQQVSSEPESVEQTEVPAEQLPTGSFKTKLLDFLGTLLLIFSLAVFGLPMIIGKSKRKFSAAACILLSLVIAVCAGSVFTAYRHAAEASLNAALSPHQSSLSFSAIMTPLLPVSFAQLNPALQDSSYPANILEKYRTAYTLNSDVVGWLKIPNTSIDTIVTQSNNNTHYLRNDFYGKYTQYGNAFLDYRNNPVELNQNSIIYGHTTESELQVFNDLYKYMDYSFYINNPVIEFGTLYKDYEWKVFSVYITNVESKDDNGYFFYYIHPEIDTSKFTGYLNQIMQRSRFYTDIGVDDNDKILTLSTCVYDNNFSGSSIDSRLVIAARLMREGESRDTDVLKVIDNPNFRRPQVWYSHFGQKNPYLNSEKWSQ